MVSSLCLLLATIYCCVLSAALRTEVENRTIIANIIDEHWKVRSKVCGTWRQDYNKFHQENLGKDKTRMLVAIPNLSGIAYFRTIISFFLILKYFNIY